MPDTSNLELEISEEIPEVIFDYVSRSHIDNEPFYIVYDKEGLKKEFGFSDTASLEDYLGELFGYDNWGYDGDYQECYNCGKAIYMDDIYQQDYWIDYEGSGIFCGDCVRNVPEVRREYIEFLLNNADACNTFLSENQLEEAGLIKLGNEYEYGYYGRREQPQQILNELREEYPNGEFLFDLDTHDRWNTKYTVWARPGYEVGAIKDEEE